jgi:hypothetical protein
MQKLVVSLTTFFIFGLISSNVLAADTLSGISSFGSGAPGTAKTSSKVMSSDEFTKYSTQLNNTVKSSIASDIKTMTTPKSKPDSTSTAQDTSSQTPTRPTTPAAPVQKPTTTQPATGQGYTGFGPGPKPQNSGSTNSGDSNNNSGNAGTGKTGGGWNIGY